jgi:hypothetical protein
VGVGRRRGAALGFPSGVDQGRTTTRRRARLKSFRRVDFMRLVLETRNSL